MITLPRLQLEDIQSGVLRPRPAPFNAAYLIMRIDDRRSGRELMRRLCDIVVSAADPQSPLRDTWVSAALSYQGLKALGVPQSSLASFAPQFQQGMAARANILGDVGASAPEHWERPLGTSDVHVIVTGVSTDIARVRAHIERAQDMLRGLSGVETVWVQLCFAHADEKEHFGFKDGISHPAIQGSGVPGTNPHEVPLKAGEFVLGYPDEITDSPPIPQPDILGRNGSYIVFRKLHQNVAAFRRYLREQATDRMDEELLAAKMMGRWRSGAPLALAADGDLPQLGVDPAQNNNFMFREHDAIGYKTPPGSHIRRMNPRDADIAGVMRIHRMIRRGAPYGPILPDGVIEDDGADRGLMFAFVGANLGRQFEFVQSEWMNHSTFFGASGANDKDPVVGSADETGSFSIPRKPIRRQLKGLPQFVITRGGEYCFMPGLSALRWLADLNA